MKDPTFKTLKNPLKEIERSQQELEKRIFHLKTLYDLSQEIGFLRGAHEIIRNLLMMIMGTFGASKGFILLVDMNLAKIEASTQRGIDINALDSFFKALESDCFKALNQTTHVLILNREEGNQEEMKNLLKPLSLLSIKIWIPFAINNQLRGSIALGEKLSGDSYTPDDQELLSTMVHQGTVAIENSLLVEQMKKEEAIRASLARYLSPQIVDQIIKKDVQVNLGGDRRVVSVLFSDVRDFTRIAETMSPDQLVQILNEYFTEMAKIIFENQGSLDKYIGDAIVAVFGSLIPLENSSQNAVQTAIQMMKQMGRLNERWVHQYGLRMEMGIGINTGEVFLGNIGSPERMEFTVIGDTVNIASRFSGVAEGGQILITKETLTALGHSIRYKELPPTEVKGKTEKLDVFEIIY
jgi:class 3 adenylate cyclase